MEDLTVATFEKNARERVHAIVKEFKGRMLIELRAYYPTENGEWKPTRHGLTLRADKAGLLLKAAEAIAAEVRRIEAETPHEGIDEAKHVN